MENRKNIFEIMKLVDDNLEKQLLYLNECIASIDYHLQISDQHITFLYNLRVKLTLRYIAKYNKYPDVRKYYKN